MVQHENAIKLISSIDQRRDLNEATTRSRIIDTVLYDVFSWPKNAVTHEETIHNGYADYTLKDTFNTTILIIEAKKEGIHFSIPTNKVNHSLYKLIKLKTLLTDTNIRDAVMQVRQYCLNSGVQLAGITNGHEWIFFKTFAVNEDWTELSAYVISNINYFSEEFTEAYKIFNYMNVVRNKSLQNILHAKLNKSRQTFSIKNQINSFDVPVDLNKYAQYISSPIKYYFGDFEEKDYDFMENCYVDERLYKNTNNTLKTLLIDNASPYLKNHGVIDYTREKLAKKMSKKISNFSNFSENKHIVIIYGDRGSGKSTFIKKLLNFDIPEDVHNKLEVVYLDLLNYAAIKDDLSELKKRLWKSVIEGIDIDDLVNDYTAVQDILFIEEFKTYKKQLASLYQEGSDAYGHALQTKILEELDNHEKLALKLAEYLRNKKSKEIVLILDNTDQYDADTQDFCFQMVAEIFNIIKCLSIITIREERFFRSKNLGVLDAYETTQYHIASPHADKVFIKRLEYLINSISHDDFFENLIQNRDINERDKKLVSKENFMKYFQVFMTDFKKKSNLYSFLVSCAQNDMRKALDLFRQFVVSGYLNVADMISTSGNIYTLQIHQVLKPLMTPEKYFYDENIGSVPNIFRLRYQANGSHFSSIRILKYLEVDNNEYASLAVLKNEFNDIFSMEEDFIKSLEHLLEYKLIEANIKVDSFVSEVEQIKITPFGKYFIDTLIHFFTYLDLICTDCKLYDEQSANYIAKSANEEYDLFHSGNRGYRMIKRVEKTNCFVEYLIAQEREEMEKFNFNNKFLIMDDLLKHYKKDLEKVKRSALRQNYSSNDEHLDLEEFFENIDILENRE